MSVTKIRDVKPGMRNIMIEGVVVSKEDIPTSSKPLAKAIIDDGTGSIILNLWRDQVDQVRAGNRIVVKEGFVKAWRGKLELSTWSKIYASDVKSKNCAVGGQG